MPSNPTPEELARLPEFDGKRIVDHWDDGFSWSWKSGKGHTLSPMDATEKAMLSTILTDRRTMERYRGALESIGDKTSYGNGEQGEIAREALKEN